MIKKEKDKANVLDIDSWRFYVIAREKINKNFGDQKSISLSRIEALDKPVTFDELKEKIKKYIILTFMVWGGIMTTGPKTGNDVFGPGRQDKF